MRNSKQKILDEIKSECEKDTALIIDPNFPQLVFGKGNINTSIVIIGEAAGKNEALQGIPFVGAAGKKLDMLLHTIGLTLNDCYIANILKYRPVDNSPPTPEQMRLHTPYLIKQIETIQPNILIPLGNFATKFVLAGFSVEKSKDIQQISELHGKEKTIIIDGKKYTVIPLFHPAAMIYNQKLKETMLADMQKLKSALHAQNEIHRT